MSGKTTSDQLKEFFAQNGGGDEKDWKRLSKKKNAEGQWVREFENRQTGVQLEVVETGPGQFKARRLTADANASFAASNALATEPVIDKDPARNAAADQVIEKLLAPYADDADEEDEGDIPRALLKKAGTALANRFVFAIGGDPAGGLMDGLWVEISPGRGEYDQHLEHVIGHLLPPGNGGEVMEITFDFSEWKDPVKLVSDLMKRGFVWDEGYQAALDANAAIPHLPALKAAFGKSPPVAPPAVSPPKP